MSIRQPQVSKYLRGAAPLPVHLFDPVAALIGISPSDLIAPEGLSLWEQEELSVIADVHELPDEVRKGFVNQWRVMLDTLARGKVITQEQPAVDAMPKTGRPRRLKKKP